MICWCCGLQCSSVSHRLVSQRHCHGTTVLLRQQTLASQDMFHPRCLHMQSHSTLPLHHRSVWLIDWLKYQIHFWDQELISYRYSSCCCYCDDRLQKRLILRSFKSDLMKFGRIVLQINQLTESDFGYHVILSRWRPRCHFTKKPKALSFQMRSGWNLANMFFE